ncbi:hypothetical protein BV898_15858 [Hypsibius exemplaris]|uniref:Receptor ligand binding region domain-containing protein n=1 Tax=Hypsibius exemplaris TaxID=2072580 RepID=A0A9X6NDY4_HYPEX|nr:hypothetical protein BV898_15858 [Hypsibius exemplaris]
MARFVAKFVFVHSVLHRAFISGVVTDGLLPRVHIVSPGFFGWSQPASLSYFAPAVDTGLAVVRRKYPHFNWTSEFLTGDDMNDCFTLRDNIQYQLSKWYYNRQYADDVLTVIVAPGCFESRFLNQLAAGWDVPLITGLDYTDNMGDRREFPTYVTTSPLTPVNGVIFCALFARMNWTRLYLLHDTVSGPYYAFQASVLPLSIPANCRTLVTQQRFASTNRNVSLLLQPILRDFNSKSRVLLYLGLTNGLRLILTEAANLNMTSGEHVMREAYRAVMLVKLVDTTTYSTPPIRQFASEWRALARDKYNNTNLRHDLMLNILIAGHTAVELMAEAIQLAAPRGWNQTPPSGKLLADHLLNQTFDLDIGKARILKQGQLSVRHVATCFDLPQGSFSTCLISRNDALTERFLWDRDTSASWFGGQSFPVDEPRCGFDGQRNECASKSNLRDRLAFGVVGPSRRLCRISLQPWKLFGGSPSKVPALQLDVRIPAEDSVKDCYSLRDNIQHELARWYYARPDGADNMLTVIITPGCYESQYLSQFAAGWDVLLITSLGYAENMGDRREFPTYVTTSPLTPKNDVLFCALFAQMNWTRLYLLQDTGRDTNAQYYASQAAYLPLSIPAYCRVQLTRQQFSSTAANVSQQLQPILRDFNSRSRVLLFMGTANGLRTVLIDANRLNMTSGEHVFLAYTMIDGKDSHFTWETQNEDDELVRRAYRAVMLIKLIDMTTYSFPPMRQLATEWLALAQAKYNYTNLPSDLVNLAVIP